MNANKIDTGPSLWQVTMPIIRVMRDADLSWDDRISCALAITRCHHHHRQLLHEAQEFAQRQSQRSQS